jgi:hypothetical protein
MESRYREVKGAGRPPLRPELAALLGTAHAVKDVPLVRAARRVEAHLGLYPIVSSQYSSTACYQASYHIQSLFF